ncbi:hypothetical protein [Actinomadura craniellae]|uniref:hypothetical protein n=1 Tax=Actinomadura craniellae TaxID=2231787 RepID=UPI001314B8F0|nr:hypothetical protein [Actinomadura craniellae]
MLELIPDERRQPGRLWENAERAVAAWERHGRPAQDSYLLTIAPQGQTVTGPV